MGLNILISAGHTNSGNKGCGAVGFINESTENRILAKKVVNFLKKAGHEVDYHEVNEGSDYLKQQVSAANKKNYDLVVQIHFNANTRTTSPMGTETLYSSARGKVWAEKVTNKLGQMYKQRGAKLRDNLYWLNNTKSAAILIETCFVDSKADTDIYMINKDLTAKLIAEAIHGSSIPDNVDAKKTYTNCVLYGNDIDKVGAEIIGWNKPDCIVKNIKDHVKWEASNLFVVGGVAIDEMKKLDNGEKYAEIKGSDRYETVKGCLKFIGKI